MIFGNEHFFSRFNTAASIYLSVSLSLLEDSIFDWIGSDAVNTNKYPPAPSLPCSWYAWITFETFLAGTRTFNHICVFDDQAEIRRTLFINQTSQSKTWRTIHNIRLRRAGWEFKITALCRLEHLERRLDKKCPMWSLKDEYHKFMRGYLIFFPHHPEHSFI